MRIHLDKLINLFLYVKKTYETKNGIYFLNGTPALPPPLSKTQESALVELLAQGDAAAQEKLIVHNLRLVVYIAKKYENASVGIEDLISIGTIGLIKAVKTYRPDKNIKLATYASRCVENEILMFLRKASNKGGEISIDEPLNVDWDGNELLLSDILATGENTVGERLENDDEVRLLLQCISNLAVRDRRIICMRFGLCGNREYTQKEVADALGISQSYISRIEKKILAQLKNAIEKETSIL